MLVDNMPINLPEVSTVPTYFVQRSPRLFYLRSHQETWAHHPRLRSVLRATGRHLSANKRQIQRKKSAVFATIETLKSRETVFSVVWIKNFLHWSGVILEQFDLHRNVLNIKDFVCRTYQELRDRRHLHYIQFRHQTIFVGILREDIL